MVQMCNTITLANECLRIDENSPLTLATICNDQTLFIFSEFSIPNDVKNFQCEVYLQMRISNDSLFQESSTNSNLLTMKAILAAEVLSGCVVGQNRCFCY